MNIFCLGLISMGLIWSAPTRAAVIETNDWSNMTQAGWTYTVGRPVIDASAGLPSGGSGLKFIYPAGTYTTSFGGGRAEFNGLSGRDIYIGHWMKFSNGFTWNPVGTKIDYQWVALMQTAINSVGAFTIRTDTLGTRLAVDVTIQGNGQFVGIPHTVYGQYANPFIPGQIYWLEYHVKLNDVIAPDATVAQVIPNGVLEVWINDRLHLSRNDLRWTDREGQTWKTFQHSAEWGGGGGTIPAEQYLWVDHTVMSTTRIGMPGGPPPPPPPLDAQAPSIPAGLSAQAASSSQINLTWTASTDNVGVTGYRIFRGGTPIGTSAGTSFSNTGLSASTTYSYTVAAYDAAGNTSGQSVAASATTQASTAGPVGTVSNLSAVAAGANGAALSFTEVSDGTGQPAKYNIRFSSSGALWGPAPSVTQGTCATPLAGTTVGATKTCTVIGLSPATAYQFQLVPYRGTLSAGAVFGPLSNVASATTTSGADVKAPANPQNLRTQ